MNKAVGIRFKPAGKIYDFDCGAYVLKPGDHVIVQTDQGLGYGTVARPPESYDEKKLKRPLKKIFRLATEKDFAQLEKNSGNEQKAYEYCQQCIKDLKLSMNLFSVESTFDGGKMTYFFTAEARVDFRELVKMLVKKHGTRVEMRQVGIRNQAKMCGGLGRCGRELCCSSFIDKFDPVSIRMAKDQGLSLNPTKISGQCGRLMCCLTYEHKIYSDLKKKFPKIGKPVNTKFGKGKVLRHNILAGRMVVRVEGEGEKELGLDDIVEAQSAEKAVAQMDGSETQGKTGGESQRHRGSEAQRRKGTEAQRHKGPGAQRHRGPEAQRHKGAETQRHKGTEAQRHKGIEAQKTVAQKDGTETQENKGREAQKHRGGGRNSGSEAQRHKGAKRRRDRGAGGQRHKGGKPQRQNGKPAQRRSD